MCGIYGKAHLFDEPVDRRLIARMGATLIHRGPDDEGTHTGPHVGLGQRRLAIIDLSREATAPLSNEDATVWLTFNGEIYNFQPLRAALMERGHRFRTRTDTEVLVHLYEEYGTQCLAHLRGMFAFALWDARHKTLFAARDRLGKKPFCYATPPGAIVFASEIKAVTVDPEVPIAPNYRAIDDYLTYQYVPSPHSAFDGVFKLPPAHFLTWSVGGSFEVRRYWQPPLAEKTTASAEEIAGELLQRLREAVRLRLVADVSLGALLSGGIDSATIVALMAEASDRPVKTFSIGFEEEVYDERPYARQVAERYGTEHHEFVVRPQAADVLPLLIRHYNEPFADSSALATYYVCKLTRQYVTVTLSGDGGDENFAGYENYALMTAWMKADVVPTAARRAMGLGLAALLDRLPYTNSSARASRALFLLGARLPERFRLQTTILKPQEKRVGYTRHFRSLLNGQAAAAAEPCDLPWDQHMDALDWMMRHDQYFYLPDCLMVKTDIASMANSLEVRCPLLDHRLIEFTATIPSSLKRNTSGGKVILKRAVQELLPPAVLAKRKTGFGLPLAKWLRGELVDVLRGTLLDDDALRRGLFEPRFLKRMVEEHVAGHRNWDQRLWALMFLELWFRQFID